MKKILIITLIAAFVLAIGVFAVVTITNNISDPEKVALKSDNPVIGTWVANPEKSTDAVTLKFETSGKVSGTISNYKFSGTFFPVKNGDVKIYNKNNKEAYIISLTNSNKTMNMNPTAAGASMSWILYHEN